MLLTGEFAVRLAALNRASFLVCCSVTWVTGFPTALQAQAPLPKATEAMFHATCVDCHSEADADGGVRFDLANWDLSNDEQRRQLERAYRRVADGEMPPRDYDDFDAEVLHSGHEALHVTLHEYDARRQAAEGRSRLRRMSNAEYQYTVHDLLGIDTPLKSMLPPDTVAHGFDKTADALSVTSVLIEKYLDAADVAVTAAMTIHPPQERSVARYRLRDELVVAWADDDKATVATVSDAALQGPTALQSFRAPHAGTYRFRMKTVATSEELPVTFAVHGGDVLSETGSTHLIDYFETSPAGRPDVIEFTSHLAEGGTIRVSPLPSHRHNPMTRSEIPHAGGLAVEWVEVDGPMTEAWPPARHHALFGDLPLIPTDRQTADELASSTTVYHVVSETPSEDAERLVLSFANRAFRRPVAKEEIAAILALTQQKLADSGSFHDAIAVGVKAVLCSPEFLCIGGECCQHEDVHTGTSRLTDYALASRLSYFLWSSGPDDELLALAADGSLNESDVLRQQTERMLSDTKSQRLIDDLLRQWFDLAWIGSSIPDPNLFPEYDDVLKVAMVRETEMFVTHMFTENLPVTSLVDSEFTFLNRRLAEHYGLPPVTGLEMQRVALPDDSDRGGLLTHASIMKVTANGTNSSPVWRGLWVLENILGQPVPPPPRSVAAVEPDVRGATSVREQFAAHRTDAVCASCHDKIDPLGFALECFDPIGRKRDYYRSMGEDLPPVDDTVRGQAVQYRRGPDVSAGDRFTNGQTFDDIQQFKALLCADSDQLARCVAEKFLVYSTGAGVTFSDHETIDDVIKQTRGGGHGIRSILHAVVQSDAFRTK